MDFVADGLRARIEQPAPWDGTPATRATNGTLAAAFGAWDEDDPAAALERLQEELAGADPEDRDRIRRVMVAIFTELGPLTLSPQSTAAASPRP